jgi:hypothetical protein
MPTGAQKGAPPGEGGAVVCELMSVNKRCRATAVPYRGGGSSRCASHQVTLFFAISGDVRTKPPHRGRHRQHEIIVRRDGELRRPRIV